MNNAFEDIPNHYRIFSVIVQYFDENDKPCAAVFSDIEKSDIADRRTYDFATKQPTGERYALAFIAHEAQFLDIDTDGKPRRDVVEGEIVAGAGHESKKHTEMQSKPIAAKLLPAISETDNGTLAKTDDS